MSIREGTKAQSTKVKSVRRVGRGRCYDFTMASPHNNYIADGLVVHNTTAMTSVGKSMRPRNEKDVADLISVNRPGVVRAGMLPVYLHRRHAAEDLLLEKRAVGELAETPHPLMSEVTQQTFGVVVYQEQVMEIVRKLAGYSMSEADGIRKIMGKIS